MSALPDHRSAHRPAGQEPDLLRLADFKWLVLACQGRHLDLGRMLSEPGYALQCATQALATEHPVVQRCAQGLIEALSAPPPGEGPASAAAD